VTIAGNRVLLALGNAARRPKKARNTLLLGSRALAVAVVGLAALGWAGRAGAANECRGLDVCISVPGPWVAVPGAPRGAATTVYYRLSCPRGSIVGGLDAVRGDRSLDVRFLGRLGSPVNPGITTSQSAVFVVTYARGRATYFRPFLGCIPTSGGGGRETTSVDAAAPRPAPTLRRVRTLRVRAGGRPRLAFGCQRDERLVGSSHAVAFRMRTAPTASMLAGARAARSQRGGRVEVRATRSGAVPRRVRVEVQVHALCARGPR
jgi:hypothetical protein